MMIRQFHLYGQHIALADTSARTFGLQHDQSHANLQSFVSFWEDTTGYMPLSNVLHQQFSAMPRKNWMEAVTRNARSRFWMRFLVDNMDAKDTLRLIFFPGMHGKTELYLLRNKAAIFLLAGGFMTPGPIYNWQTNAYGLPLEVPPMQSSTYLVSISNFFKLYDQVRAESFKADAYRAYCSTYKERQLPFLLFLGFIVGSLIILTIFGLMLFLLTRRRASLWYALFTLANSLNFVRVIELYADVRWVSNFVPFFPSYLLVSFSAVSVFYLYFIANFLGIHLQKHSVRIQWFIRFSSVIFGLMLVSWSFNFYGLQFSHKLMLGFNIIHITLFAPAIWILFVMLKSGGLLPRLVALGTAFIVLGGGVSFALNLFARQRPLHEMTIFESPSFWLGIFSLLESLCFVLAIGYNFKLLEQEKQILTLERERDKERIRARIAQDIHDEVGGKLTKISLAAQLAARIPDLDIKALRVRISQLGNDARIAAASLREVVFAINPDYDLFSEMQAYFRDTAREFWHNTEVDLVFDFPEPEKDNPVVSPDLKRHLLLIFKEAMNNVAKHSGATAVILSLKTTTGNSFLLAVTDNGKGFFPEGNKKATIGMSGMKKRAESMGANLTVVSRSGVGTKILVEGNICPPQYFISW